MKKKPIGDVFTLFADFQKKVLTHKPSVEAMYSELQMMKFKIRPLQGDVSILNLKDDKLIEILWNLGKLDEFFQSEYSQVSVGDKKTFFQLFDNIHQKYQDKLNALNLKTEENIGASPVVEMEIFKEEKSPARIN